MKKPKILFAICGLATAGSIMISADLLEAPAAAGTTADITDVYAFEGADPDNTVFVARSNN